MEFDLNVSVWSVNGKVCELIMNRDLKAIGPKYETGRQKGEAFAVQAEGEEQSGLRYHFLLSTPTMLIHITRKVYVRFNSMPFVEQASQ